MQLTADTRNPPFSFAGGRIHNSDRESNRLAYLDLASKSSSSKLFCKVQLMAELIYHRSESGLSQMPAIEMQMMASSHLQQDPHIRETLDLIEDIFKTQIVLHLRDTVSTTIWSEVAIPNGFGVPQATENASTNKATASGSQRRFPGPAILTDPSIIPFPHRSISPSTLSTLTQPSSLSPSSPSSDELWKGFEDDNFWANINHEALDVSQAPTVSTPGPTSSVTSQSTPDPAPQSLRSVVPTTRAHVPSLPFTPPSTPRAFIQTQHSSASHTSHSLTPSTPQREISMSGRGTRTVPERHTSSPATARRLAHIEAGLHLRDLDNNSVPPESPVPHREPSASVLPAHRRGTQAIPTDHTSRLAHIEAGLHLRRLNNSLVPPESLVPHREPPSYDSISHVELPAPDSSHPVHVTNNIIISPSPVSATTSEHSALAGGSSGPPWALVLRHGIPEERVAEVLQARINGRANRN